MYENFHQSTKKKENEYFLQFFWEENAIMIIILKLFKFCKM